DGRRDTDLVRRPPSRPPGPDRRRRRTRRGRHRRDPRGARGAAPRDGRPSGRRHLHHPRARHRDRPRRGHTSPRHRHRPHAVQGDRMSYDPNSLEGVPADARGRLAQNKAGLFTSDLSVREFLLVKEAGFDPLGVVVGSSIYHIGFQQSNWNQNQEMDVLTQAMYHARELAMTRMEEEADQLGAAGIVGVRLDVGRYEWGADLAEFIAIGTAVKHRGGELHRAPNGRPFTSDLPGQDFWTLLRAGYRPVG